ncbi:CHAT domain-containing protein [Thalassomonas actiniarum]|uniref:CHAT domain-containing protein n=1 Tax=Thalassomonas actiniarum TaxID=485447 RepID=A0AAE9YQ84_9GAMM|nr:CHAT domain-containing protein [Thalassomonas actiniarum]WDD99200.1 CHAT domain-containing protein [Thalassomonas actiniarum]
MASYYPGMLYWLLGVVIAYPGAGFACSSNSQGQKPLGEYQSQLPANAPLLLLIKQDDLDIHVIRKLNNREIRSNTPSGRNGYEFIYIKPGKKKTGVKLCFFSRYQDAATGSYHISQVKNANSDLIHAIELMDKAARAWSEDTELSRLLASAYFDQVAKLDITKFDLSNHARLYSLNAKIVNYQYNSALALAKALSAKVPAKSFLGYSALWGKGKVLIRQNKQKAAITPLSDAVTIAESLLVQEQSASAKDIADLKNWLAEAYLMDGQIKNGETLLNEAQILAGNDAQLLGAIYNNLGYVYLLASKLTSGRVRAQYINTSINEHKLARNYAKNAGDWLELIYIENNMGTLYQRIGSLRKAREHYWQALDLIARKGTPFRLQVIYTNLGRIYQHLGDYQKSESFLKKALEIAGQGQSSRFRLSQLQCSLGNSQRLMGRPQTALINHNLCIRSAIEENNRELLLTAQYELAEDYIHLGRIRDARKTTESIIEKLAPDIGQDSGLYSLVLNQYAKLNYREGKLDKALANIKTALKYSLSSRNPSLHIKILNETMQIYKALGNPTEALAYGQKALKEVEQLHQHLEAERLGPAWSKITHGIFLNVAEIFLNQYLKNNDSVQLYQVLNVLERSRAITLRQEFALSDEQGQKNKATDHLITLSELADSHANHSSNSSYTPLPLSFYHEHELLNFARLNDKKNAPIPPVLKYKQIQEKLRKQQTVLYYLTLKKAVYALTMTKSNIALHHLGAPENLNKLIQQARSQLADLNSSPYQTLHSLSELLLAPLSIPDDTQDLILVLHRNLHALPFSALPVISALPAYKPLSSKFNLQVVPSISSYFMSKNNGNGDSYALDLAMFADPQLSPLVKNQYEYPANKAPLQSWSRNLPHLPWTAREAGNLEKIFAKEHYQIYTGAAANRTNLRSPEVRHARILHIASHGYFHSLNPDNIGFALSANDKQGEYEPGFITLTELFSFRFNNELVVISGCDTGMGKSMDGEGMLGLSRGFISQGAKHVISTLWPVADKASAKFMQLFYHRLKQLGEVDQALRAAQNDMRTIPTYNHPFYWAAYVLNTVSPEQSISFSPKTL